MVSNHTNNQANRMHKMSSFRKLTIGVISVALVVYGIFYSPLPFAKSLWISGSNHSYDFLKLRNRMADGILISDGLLGKDRLAVIERLGQPTNTAKFDSWDLVYRLGNERGFISIDSEWLVIRFDSSGRVSKASLVRD